MLILLLCCYSESRTQVLMFCCYNFSLELEIPDQSCLESYHMPPEKTPDSGGGASGGLGDNMALLGHSAIGKSNESSGLRVGVGIIRNLVF